MSKATFKDLTHPNLHKLKHFCKQLLEKYNIETIILFGSTAKGTNNYRSDFDLIIVTDDMGEDWFIRHRKVFALSIGLIQPFVLTREEFSHAVENRQTIVWEALVDGIILHDNGLGREQIQRFQKLLQKGEIERLNKGWRILSK
ncbi:MAG: nucleotidyltransferase domain-containing protein [Candidatus Heimdallarchaeota archaeon]